MDIEKEIKQRFKGYHVEVMFYPSGGRIECTGCEVCKTDECQFESVAWYTEKGGTLASAMGKLEEKMTTLYGSEWGPK